MSSHATAETLSSYLDQELDEIETRRIEEHVQGCEVCHERLHGMKSVVAGLRHLERMAPPPTLDGNVARRIALLGDERSLLDRVEENLGGVQRPSSIFFLFALTIALAVIVLLFGQALEQQRRATTPVIFQDPPPAGTAAEVVVAGRTFRLREGLWTDLEADPEAVDVTLAADSAAWRALVAEQPRLAGIERLGGPVVVRVEERTVRLEPAESP